jgi:hypothetical protein
MHNNIAQLVHNTRHMGVTYVVGLNIAQLVHNTKHMSETHHIDPTHMPCVVHKLCNIVVHQLDNIVVHQSIIFFLLRWFYILLRIYKHAKWEITKCILQ